MPLDSDDRRIVIDLLARRLAREDFMRNWLSARVVDDEFALALDQFSNAQDYAREAVRVALELGDACTPRWIVSLLGGLPESDQVLELIARAERPQPQVDAGVDPFETPRLHGGSPFLNRTVLRASLKQKLLPANKGVLIVNGPTKSGKSYTRSFIEYVCRLPESALPPGEPFRQVVIDLDPDDAPTFGPDALAEDLVSRMERRSVAPAPGGDSRPRELERWIFGEAAETKLRWWWVFDGFANPDLPKDTKVLLHRLLLRVGEGPAAQRVRIALIDYEEALRDEIEANVEREQLGDPAGVGELYVSDYFKALFGTSEAEQEQRRATIESILDSLPENGSRLRVLRDRLETATREIEASNGHA